MITVFSKDWFVKYQKHLLRFANSRYGRYVLRIHGDRSDVGKNKITKLEPNAITWREGEQFKVEFRADNKFSKRLYHAYKPLWHLIHMWDMSVANNLTQTLNLGFDSLEIYSLYPYTNTVAGDTLRIDTNVTFASLRSGAGMFVSESTTFGASLYSDTTSNRFDTLSRGIILFDTSSLDGSAIISSTSMSLYGSAKNATLGNTGIEVVSSTPLSNSSLDPTDYTDLGSTSFATLDTSVISSSSYNVFDFNQSGMDAVSKIGITKLGLRLSWDLNNSFTGVWASNQSTLAFFNTPKNSGTSKDPKILITYSVTASTTYSNANPYASGLMRYKESGGSWTNVTSGDMYFVTYTTDGVTEITYNSQDPSDILKAVIDNYRDYGGQINYNTDIDDTLTTVSYTFNTNTILECINKCIELAPNNWYWYVDPATNLVHFHEKSSTVDHYLTIGKDIESMDIEYRAENIINTVYFTGGGDPPLYKKYQNASSVGTYGIRALRYTDQRVTVAATALLIANTILNRQAVPEIRLRLLIADSNHTTSGYDIESVNVGDVVNILNTEVNSASSLWDIARFDSSTWDYDLDSIGSIYFQITRKEYSPNGLYVICSTIPPDISKRIEDINRNLEASLSANNPSSPA